MFSSDPTVPSSPPSGTSRSRAPAGETQASRTRPSGSPRAARRYTGSAGQSAPASLRQRRGCQHALRLADHDVLPHLADDERPAGLGNVADADRRGVGDQQRRRGAPAAREQRQDRLVPRPRRRSSPHPGASRRLSTPSRRRGQEGKRETSRPARCTASRRPSVDRCSATSALAGTSFMAPPAGGVPSAPPLPPATRPTASAATATTTRTTEQETPVAGHGGGAGYAVAPTTAPATAVLTARSAVACAP